MAANQWFIDEVRKGVQVDFMPMSSPDWAMTQDAVLTGRVSVAAQRGPQVKVTLDMTDSLTGLQVPEQVEFLLRIGPVSELTDEKLSAIGGDALLVVRNLGDSDDPAAVLEVPPDGLWLSVPGGLAGPHIDYSDTPEAWPEVSTLEELATVLTSRAGSPPPPPAECSAAYQNPPFVNDTGLTERAFSSVDEVFGLAMACDEDGLVVRALADGTKVVVGDGTVAEQLVTPDLSGAYLALAAAVTTSPVTSTSDDGERHTYRLDGWTVVFDQDGRWLEFTGP